MLQHEAASNQSTIHPAAVMRRAGESFGWRWVMRLVHYMAIAISMTAPTGYFFSFMVFMFLCFSLACCWRPVDSVFMKFGFTAIWAFPTLNIAPVRAASLWGETPMWTMEAIS